MSAESLQVRVRASYGDFTLDLDTALEGAGVTAVYGASGAGKSTLLRTIAGFEQPQTGRIALGDQVWFDADAQINWPPHKRPVGYVFQDGRLFPHQSVDKNLRYAKRRAPAGGPTLDDVAEALDLGPLFNRRPDHLSGGERQRAALGRTLLSNPRLLLLDEPISALDTARKQTILPYLDTVRTRFNLPTLYVSHSLDECAQLASHMLVLSRGCEIANGDLKSVMETLDLDPTAMQADATDVGGVVIDGRVTNISGDLGVAHLDIGAGQTLSAPLPGHPSVSDEVRLRVRARDVAIALDRPQRISIQNQLKGVIQDIRDEAASIHCDVLIDLGTQRIRARITKAAQRDLSLSVGQTVFALVKTASLEGRR